MAQKTGPILRLRPDLDVIPMESGRIQLRSGDEDIYILETSAASDAVAAFLQEFDGSVSTERAIERHLAAIPEPELRDLVTTLLAEALLVESSPVPLSDRRSSDAPLAGFLARFRLRPEEIAEKVSQTPILILANGRTGEALKTLLESDGARAIKVRSLDDPAAFGDLEHSPPGGTFPAVMLDREAPAACRRVNRLCLEKEIPWIVAHAGGGLCGTVGPFFFPGKTACYECFEERLRANRASPEAFATYERWLDDEPATRAPRSVPAALAALVAAHAELEILKHLLGFGPLGTYSRLLLVDFLKAETRLEPVWRVPWCPACSRRGRTG